VEKPETLTTFGQLFTQKYKIHDNSNLQPAGGGQINLAKCGQNYWLVHLVNSTFKRSFIRLQLSAAWGAKVDKKLFSTSFLFLDPCNTLGILNKTCIGSVKGVVATLPFINEFF